jgi:hypothetical protein
MWLKLNNIQEIGTIATKVNAWDGKSFKEDSLREQVRIFHFFSLSLFFVKAYLCYFAKGLWIRIDSFRIQKFSSIRIRIHNVNESGSNPDPDTDQDPQQYRTYFRIQIFSKIRKSTKKVKHISSLYRYYFYTFPL